MLSYSNDLDTIPNEENLLTLYLKDQSTINTPLPEDPTHRSRLILGKYALLGFFLAIEPSYARLR
jgi:hypothetical protein